MPKKPAPGSPIVKRLRALVQTRPELRHVVAVYEAILPLVGQADLHVAAVPFTEGQIRSKMEQGLPLLHNEAVALDIAAARDLLLCLARAVESVETPAQYRGPRLPWLRSFNAHTKEARQFRLALEDGRLDVSALLLHIAAGDKETALAALRPFGFDVNLALLLAQNALKPALRAWCRQVSPVANGISWNKGICFVCGAAATLGELQENDQVKHLRCGSCGADWTLGRLRCIYCGNDDHKTKHYLYEETLRDQQLVEVCDQCKGYLKIIAAFTPTAPELLPVEDLATLHLDYIAQERGYSRPAMQ